MHVLYAKIKEISYALVMHVMALYARIKEIIYVLVMHILASYVKLNFSY